MTERLIFISYARKDGLSFAKELHDRLIQADLLPWLDLQKIKSGEWRRKIDMAIEDCIVFILVVTPGSIASPNVAYEYRYAMGLGKLIIPLIIDPSVRIDPDIPEDLRRYQIKNFIDPTHDEWEKFGRELQFRQQELDIPDEIREAKAKAKSSSLTDRKDALDYLCTTDHPSARKALEELCSNHNSNVKMEAALAFARITNPPSLICLEGLKLAADDNRHDGNARLYLIQMNNEDAANVLFEVYKSGKGHHQKQTMQAMVEFSNPCAIPHLREMYKDRTWTNALKKLAQFGDVKSIEDIEARICDKQTSHEDLQYYMTMLSTKFDAPELVGSLIRILKKFSEWYNQHPGDYYRGLMQLTLNSLDKIGTEEVAILLLDAIEPPNRHHQMLRTLGNATLASIRRKLDL
jgi:hypothetical protein